MPRQHLGTWRCASGRNSLDVYLLDAPGPVRELEVVWETLPPAPADQIEYFGRILPAILQRVQEYLEKPGPALVVLG